MKAVILAGGYGTRISEESVFKPKPMIEIGGMPILWHIMKELSFYGINDFIICAGYKQEYIKRWFADFSYINNDVTFDFRNETKIIHQKAAEPWKVSVIDTGLDTMTGGRIKRVKEFIGAEPFLVTYGDGVGDIDISALYSFHKQHGKIATISVYNFGQNKGVLKINGSVVESFREKSSIDNDLINIGFMIFEPKIFDYLENDLTILEQDPMRKLINDKQLMAYHHKGFWQCMDTLREKQKLEKYWESEKAPWKLW